MCCRAHALPRSERSLSGLCSELVGNTKQLLYRAGDARRQESDKDWVNNIRPTLVRAGEDGLFMEFECWAEDIRRESFIVNDRELRYAGGSWGTAPDLDGATDVVRASMKIRKLLDDDQIVRFNDEVTP